MNIIDAIKFNNEEPVVLSLRKTSKTNVLSIGLLENQILTTHIQSL